MTDVEARALYSDAKLMPHWMGQHFSASDSVASVAAAAAAAAAAEASHDPPPPLH
jgi:hypothetical protein